MYEDMKKFLANAKVELGKAYEAGTVEDINKAADKILNITKSMLMMSVENIHNIEE